MSVKPGIVAATHLVCTACGVLVGDIDAHDRWHRSVAAVGHIANRADARADADSAGVES